MYCTLRDLCVYAWKHMITHIHACHTEREGMFLCFDTTNNPSFFFFFGSLDCKQAHLQYIQWLFLGLVMPVKHATPLSACPRICNAPSYLNVNATWNIMHSNYIHPSPLTLNEANYFPEICNVAIGLFFGSDNINFLLLLFVQMVLFFGLLYFKQKDTFCQF